MDLTLPLTAPELGKYNRYNWDFSSFAIYTLANLSKRSLRNTALKLEREWWEQFWQGILFA